jgi:hypothetical protein
MERNPAFLSDWVCAAGNALMAELEKVCRCERFENGTLQIVFSNTSWKNQVDSMAPDLKRRINGLAGKNVVQSVRARVDSSVFKKKPSRPAAEDKPEPSKDVLEAAAEIENPRVRRAFTTLGAKWERLSEK